MLDISGSCIASSLITTTIMTMSKSVPIAPDVNPKFAVGERVVVRANLVTGDMTIIGKLGTVRAYDDSPDSPFDYEVQMDDTFTFEDQLLAFEEAELASAVRFKVRTS